LKRGQRNTIDKKTQAKKNPNSKPDIERPQSKKKRKRSQRTANGKGERVVYEKLKDKPENTVKQKKTKELDHRRKYKKRRGLVGVTKDELPGRCNGGSRSTSLGLTQK